VHLDLTRRALPVSSSPGTPRDRADHAPGTDTDRRFLLGALAAGLLTCRVGTVRAQAESVAMEYQIKAAFLYKFIDYVEWPQASKPWPQAALVIGVTGSNSLADELAAIVAQRSAPNRQIVVRRLQGAQNTEGLHVLFVGKGAGASAEDLLRTASARPILTVTETEAAFALGGVINFVVEADKVRFDVALQRAERSNIKISSRLLSVARKVV